MPRRLTGLVIKEVSSVDRGAGEGVKVLLMKRDDQLAKATDFDAAEKADAVQRAIWALQSAITSILGDEDVEDKDAALAESIDQFKAYVASSGKVEKTDMPLPKTDEEFAKAISDAVTAAMAKATEASAALLAKKDAELAIAKLSDAERDYMKACDMSEDAQKAFASRPEADRKAEMESKPAKKRADDPVVKALQASIDKSNADNAELKKQLGTLTEEREVADFKKRAVTMGLKEEDGETVRKAFKGDAEAQAKLEKRMTEISKALVEARNVGKVFDEFGSGNGGDGTGATAYGQLMAKAEELLKSDAGKGMTKDVAFTKVYENPANADLVQQHKQDEARKLNQRAAA